MGRGNEVGGRHDDFDACAFLDETSLADPGHTGESLVGSGCTRALEDRRLGNLSEEDGVG